MSRNPKLWMSSQTIAETDGFVVALDIFCTLDQMYETVDSNACGFTDSKRWLKNTFGLKPAVGTVQFEQADLSKTEAYTEAPMTQLGCIAASSAIIDHGWCVSFSVLVYIGKIGLNKPGEFKISRNVKMSA